MSFVAIGAAAALLFFLLACAGPAPGTDLLMVSLGSSNRCSKMRSRSIFWFEVKGVEQKGKL